MKRLRVAVLNLQSGLGTTRGWWDYVVTLRHRVVPRRTRHVERVGAALRREEVDLAIFSEVDGGSGRTAGVDQGRLLRETGGFADHAFFPCFVVGERIRQGNAIHARARVRPVENHPLPGLGEPRFLSEAVVELPAGPIHVFAAHTSLDAAVRREQLCRIRDLVGGHDRPVLLAGDFNARRSDELDELCRTLRQVPCGPTFPSWKPRWELDHLFVSPHFEALRARVATEVRESDHLPLRVDLRWAESG